MQCTDPVAEGAQTHVAWANLMQMRSDVFVMYSLRTGLVFYCTALPLQLKSQGQFIFGFWLFACSTACQADAMAAAGRFVGFER